MKIAFVSFEYPPDTAFGGIATYVGHAARMLAARGHQVEVFAGSPSRAGTTTEDGIVVHRIRARDAAGFGPVIAPLAAARHDAIGGFDVVESPELNAEAAELAALRPALPLVVKLHTPSCLIGRFTQPRLAGWRRLRFALGALRRGRLPRMPREDADAPQHEFERRFALAADLVASPSDALTEFAIRDWGVPATRIARFPLPYAAAAELLAVPPDSAASPLVLFVGRLEPRKGVQHLAAAIPAILRTCPAARFRFVGRPLHSPRQGEPMDRHILRCAGRRAAASIEFTGPVPPEQIPTHLAGAMVTVFPSVWESFGYVCLEAMAAGRPVVGSAAGGMAEILRDGAGVLVPPASPPAIARAVSTLLSRPAERHRLGAAARARVLSVYGYDAVAAAQEAGYAAAIEQRRGAGPRRPDTLPRRPGRAATP